MSAITPNDMQLVCSRTIPVLDTESLECREAKEALFRNGERFVLYLSEILLSSREALLWLNENQADEGSFWE